MLWIWSPCCELSISKKRLKRYPDGNTSTTTQTPSYFSFSSSIQVPVNHVPTTILVDTGAAISLIHENTLSQMQHSPITPCSLTEVHTANSGFMSLIGLVKLMVKLNHINTYVHAYVTRDLICPMILGRDWIENNHVCINFDTHHVSLYNDLVSIPLLPVPRNDSFIMSLSHSIVIPPFHQKLISGYVPIRSLNDALFTPNLALQHNRMVLLPHTLLHVRNHHGIISVINNTRHSKVIPRNTPLGFISSSTTSPTIHVVSPTSMNNLNDSSCSLSSLSCPHCTVCFPTELTLFDHFLSCCNKDSSCPSKYITPLIEHLLDPTHKIKIYLMLHHYRALFDDSFTQGITCPPQSALNTGSQSPLAEHPRRVSPLNRQIIHDEVQKMLNNGIISPSNSPWASPVVIVKKPDGSPRFCVDYRRLNAITQKDIYPLPRIDDIIERLNGSRIFSKLDLRSGYFQVPLASADQEKTAFSTPDGHWHFNRLPQGLKNSPAVFQRLMNQTLGSLRWDISLAYLDDVIVYSPSFEQHLLDVNRVCQALHASNFKLNYQKCSIFQHDISFLGHQITPDGCLPNTDNIRSITDFPVPQSSKAAHSFLQMVGFYRKFINGFAQISYPLNKFTRKNYPFIWTSTEQESFDRLKAAITSPPVLLLPDPTQPYIIRTDASHTGVGAVLLQKHTTALDDRSTTSMYQPIAFASRSLKPAEKKYSAIELECLAIWWSVTQKFRSYIEGQQFVLETDHKPLISLMKKPYQNVRIERWMTTLQQYDMIIQHIPGKENTTADALSRYPVDKPDYTDDDKPRLINSSTQTDFPAVNLVTTRSMTRTLRPPAPISTATSFSSSQSTPPLVTSRLISPVKSSSPLHLRNTTTSLDYDTLHSHQNQDSIIQTIRNTTPLDSEYILDDHDILCKVITRRTGQILQLPYVPVSLVPSVLLLYHNSTFNGGHYGVKRTFYKLRDRFFWPKMHADIVHHISSCIDCRANKPTRRKPDGHLHPIEPPRGIWERLAMDYVGPVPTSKSGNKYFLVLTDLFSKFVITKAVPDNTSTTAAKFLLYDVFMIYGVPYEIITDNGQHFSSSLYEALLKLTGCCHIKTTPYNPKANGQCERHNATLVPNLVALSNQSRSNWDEKLIATTFNYNATRHTSTGFTPFALMFARSPRFSADLPSISSPQLQTASQYHQTMTHFIEQAKIAARQSNLQHQQDAKRRFDRHRLNPQYVIGQHVLIRNRNPHMNKFSPKFVGPYSITARLHSKTYLVQHPRTGHRAQVLVHDIRTID